MKSLALALRPLLKDVEQHRLSRKFKGEAFPDKVWVKAGELAAIYGSVAVAQATNLEPKKIKQLAQSRGIRADETDCPEFVEWTTPSSSGQVECSLELESGARKLKVQVRLDFSQLSKLAADFWEG